MDYEQYLKRYRIEPGQKVNLAKDFPTNDSAGFDRPENVDALLQRGVATISSYQDKLYAENRQSLLVVIQAMDAAGKDSCIKHVLSGVNPAGCQVISFKAPSSEELDHTYLWRCQKVAPGRGMMGIFNRSHYEEVLVVRVHPEFLKAQRLPPSSLGDGLWRQRFEEINGWEKHLHNNGTRVVKIFLNVGKDEQCVQQLERIDTPGKNWKFNPGDIKEREYWDQYMAAYEEMLQNTSTGCAPWYVIPADKRWFARLAVAAVIAETLMQMDPRYPPVSEEVKAAMAECRETLHAECGEEYAKEEYAKEVAQDAKAIVSAQDVPAPTSAKDAPAAPAQARGNKKGGSKGGSGKGKKG